MPLEFLRFAPTGPRDPRETAQKCNNLGEAAARQIAAIEARLDLLEALIVEVRVAAQGSMFLVTPEAGSDITGAFQTIDHFDTIGMTPVGCSVNTSTGEFSIDIAGSWLLLIRINLTHNESNSGRETFIRLFNVTTASAASSNPIPIGRNTPGTSDTPVLARQFPASEIGDTFRLEIGGGDTLSSVTWEASNVVLSYQGELGALSDPTP